MVGSEPGVKKQKKKQKQKKTKFVSENERYLSFNNTPDQLVRTVSVRTIQTKGQIQDSSLCTTLQLYSEKFKLKWFEKELFARTEKDHNYLFALIVPIFKIYKSCYPRIT